MSRFRIIGITLLAVLALSAAAASATQAAPFWTVRGTRLAAGQTHNITGKVFSASFTLSVPEAGITLFCASEKGEKGVLIGSNKGQPGTGSGTLVLSECTVAGNGKECKVEEPVETVPLISELVESAVKGKAGNQLLAEFKPATGAKFATVRFEGSRCLVKEATLTGSVAAEVLTDPGEEKIELEQTAKEAHSWLSRFPATPIEEVSLINTAGESKIVSVGLSSFGDTVILTGTALGLLANSKFESEETSWSPLP